MMRAIFFLGALVVFAGTVANAAPAAKNADFDTQCAFCHQAGGVGLPGQFPRLAGRVNEIARDPKGRSFLVQVMLYGMSGPIAVDNKPISGFMTPFASLSDASISGVLNYLVAQKATGANAKPFTAGEVATVRASPKMTGSQVHARRTDLVAAKIIP